MKLSPQGRKFIRSKERCSLTAYKHKDDPWTIGWGNTRYEDGALVKAGDKITIERADSLFDIIIKRFEIVVSSSVHSTINQNQYDALVSFAYNVGPKNFTTSTLLKMVNKDPSTPLIRAQFMRWIERGSIFEAGLTIRRKQEADLYYLPISKP